MINLNYNQAKRLFHASIKLKENEEANRLLLICEKELEKKGNKTQTTQEHPKSTSAPSVEVDEKEQECLRIIDKKDYYEILGVAKDVNEDDLRRSYKKVYI